MVRPLSAVDMRALCLPNNNNMTATEWYTKKELSCVLLVVYCALEKGSLRNNGIDWRNARVTVLWIMCTLWCTIEIMSTLADALPLMLIVLDVVCLTTNDNDDESTATVLYAKACCSLLLEVKSRTAPFCCFSSKIVHYFTMILV